MVWVRRGLFGTLGNFVIGVFFCFLMLKTKLNTFFYTKIIIIIISLDNFIL